MSSAAPPAGPAEPPISTTAAHYLEAIYYIVHEGEVARPSRLAEWLAVSPPTVTGVVQRMRDQGLVEIHPDRSLTLSPVGEAAAAKIVRRHRVVERWLTDQMGLDWAAADLEAAEIAQNFSDQLVDRLLEKMGNPSSCPHGNQIPGQEPLAQRLVSLAELAPGVEAPISRISEAAERDAPQLLRLLAEEGLLLGEMVAVAPPQGGQLVTVLRGERRSQLGPAVAGAVWVDLSRARAPARRGLGAL